MALRTVLHKAIHRAVRKLCTHHSQNIHVSGIEAEKLVRRVVNRIKGLLQSGNSVAVPPHKAVIVDIEEQCYAISGERCGACGAGADKRSHAIFGFFGSFRGVDGLLECAASGVPRIPHKRIALERHCYHGIGCDEVVARHGTKCHHMVVGNRHKVRCLQFISIAAYGEIGVVEQIGIVLTHKHYLIAYGATGIVECAQRAGMVQWLDVGKEIDVIHWHQAVDGEARYHVEAHCLVG